MENSCYISYFSLCSECHHLLYWAFFLGILHVTQAAKDEGAWCGFGHTLWEDHALLSRELHILKGKDDAGVSLR
jgi:hypothetical protein